MKKNNKGFTLAELLVVVAIIAVLAAISIPVFGSQLEKAREATDLANIRSAYAECASEVVTAGAGYYKAVSLSQTSLGSWVVDASNVAGADLSNVSLAATMYVCVDASGNFTLEASAPSTGYTLLQ